MTEEEFRNHPRILAGNEIVEELDFADLARVRGRHVADSDHIRQVMYELIEKHNAGEFLSSREDFHKLLAYHVVSSWAAMREVEREEANSN